MVYFVSGFRESQARKVCEFFFGDFFISCELNGRERIFEIKINKHLKIKNVDGTIRIEKIEDYVDMVHFKKFWGGQWKVTYEVNEEA